MMEKEMLVKRKVMTTLSLTLVMLAMMTMPAAAQGYTIDGDLGSDWGVDLTSAWSVNDTWVPKDDVTFIVEDNKNGKGVHIIGRGLNYAAYIEPLIQLSTGTWTYEPFGAEGFDLEAMYVDEDSDYIYIAIVTSLYTSGPPDPIPGDLALNLDGDAGTGGYGYEYGIRLSGDRDAVTQWHIYRTLADENWNVPGAVPMNKPNILNEINPGTEIGTVKGIYFNNGVYPPDDYYNPNWVIEMAIPKDKVGMAGKNLQEEPLPKYIIHTNLCGNDKLVWNTSMYTPACTLEVQKFCSVIPPTTPFVCKDIKPIDSLTMTWDGDKNISNITVYRDKYDPNDPAKNRMYTIEGPIGRGDNVTATGYVAANAKNDVDWLITFEDGTTGISRFHRSCSDEDMNGPEDCGKYEGNAKTTDPDFINLWLFEGMAGNGLMLDCTPEKPELNEDCTVFASKPGSCDDGKPTALVFEYTGDACSATTNFQNGKFTCEPTDLQLGVLADVVMTKDADKISVEIDDNMIKIFRSDTVGKEFPSEIKYAITDTDGNTQSQKLHTSCSQQLNVGDQFGSLILRDFIPKGGSVSEGNVIYTYRIINTGTGSVIVDVFDNLLGDIAENLHLMGGEIVELTEKVVLTEIGDITNTVTVTDTTDPDCFATDEVTVQVLPPPPPPFKCDGKIIEMTMTWDGSANICNITVYRDKYDPKDQEKNLMYTIEGPIKHGDNVTATGYLAANAKNDVDWLITFEDGTTGISRFHCSCSDNDMNGPEDCGKPQGDGKKNENKYINDWLLEGMVDSAGGILDCTT